MNLNRAEKLQAIYRIIQELDKLSEELLVIAPASEQAIYEAILKLWTAITLLMPADQE